MLHLQHIDEGCGGTGEANPLGLAIAGAAAEISTTTAPALTYEGARIAAERSVGAGR